MTKEDNTSAPKNAMAVRSLPRASTGRRCRASQTSQDKTTGSNSFAHPRSAALVFSETAVSAEAFEKTAMTSLTIFARWAAEHARKRLRQRDKVVTLTPHAAALLRRLLLSIIVPTKVGQRSLLRNLARGVLVRILNVRLQEPQR